MRLKPICYLFLIFISTQSIIYSQQQETVFFTKTTQVNTFHTINDLEQLKKGELIKLYYDRVKEIITILPFLSLTHETNVRLKDVGIKEDSKHLKTLKKDKEANKERLSITRTTIEEFVPYADTGKIIGTILYFEEIIKKMRIGIKNNY